MTNYPIGDFLIRIGNAAMAGKKEVEVPATKLISETAKALKKAGYLNEVTEKKGVLVASLAMRRKSPVLMKLKLISRPGLRIYLGIDDIEKKRGPSRFLISTPQGMMMSPEAIKKRVGGEVVAEIF